MEINAKIVETYEHRDIRHITDPVTGKIDKLEPVAGSERAFLTLELPDGEKLLAQVSHREYLAYVVPLIAKGEG